MKKILSFFFALLILTLVLPFGAFIPDASAAPDGFDTYWFIGADVQVSIKSYQNQYYDFDLSSLGFGTGHVYALYFADDGQISFAKAVQLVSFDAAFNQINKDVAAGSVVNISDVNGFSLALGSSGNSLCFVQASNPLNYAGLDPDKALSGIIVQSETPVAPAPPPAAPPPPATPAAPADTPKELASTFYVGQWPIPAGTYDPALDGIGIPNGTQVYGLFDSAYAVLPAPGSVTGFSKVNSPAEVAAGKYCVHVGASGFDYVLLGPAGAAAPASPSASPSPSPSEAPDASESPIVSSEPSEVPDNGAGGITVKFDENPGFSITCEGIQTSYTDGNLGYGDFHALFFDAGAKITFNSETELNNMGASQGTVPAGTVKDIADIDGWYVYLGEPSASTYVVFVGPTSAPNYASSPPDKALPASIPAMGGAAPAAPGGGGGNTLPPELATAFVVGQWPMAAGTYDPGLDGIGIPDGVQVYGLFDAAYAALPAPTSVTGFKEVAGPADVVDGTYCVVTTSGGYGYVILGSGPLGAGGGAASPAPSPAAPAPEPPAGGSASIPAGFEGFYFAGSDVQVGIKSYQDKYYDFDLGAAGFGTGHVYAIFFNDDGQVVFNQGVQLTTFDASFNQTFMNVNPGEVKNINDVNGWSFGLGTTGNSLCFVKTSDPLNYAGMTPDKALSDITLSEPPKPLEYTFRIRERKDVDIHLYDANSTYGYFYYDIVNTSQMVYMFRLKENGSVTFSKDVTIRFPDMSSGAIVDSRTIEVKAEIATPIKELHGGRWYIGNSSDDYVEFINDNGTANIFIPAKYYNPTAGRDTSFTTYKAVAINDLKDGTLDPYGVFDGDKGWSVLVILLGGLGIAIPIGIAIFIAHTRELKSGGLKYKEVKLDLE